MDDVVLKIENVSKQYRLGLVGTGSMADDLNRFWHKIRGKEDPYLKVGEVNVQDKVGGEYVWALRNIDFEIKKGEVLGIIGKNGAGKSTLLKLLSQVTAPTIGSIKVKGRIAALLEVGTGFHSELTGRENIYLNGAILGMNKQEIASKLDEIIDFSGVAKYVDTPVKRYSSGMMVRLGFAVAAHLEPDILVVDEVLAVGDAEFQKKCIGKMKDVAGEGRTVLFVSHNMASVKSLCNTGIMMEEGSISFAGTASEAVDRYLVGNTHTVVTETIPMDHPNRFSSGEAFFKKIRLLNTEKLAKNVFYFREPILIETEIEVVETIKDAIFVFILTNPEGLPVMFKDTARENPEGQYLEVGMYKVDMEINLDLLPGEYVVQISVCHENGNTIDGLMSLCSFAVEKTSLKKKEEYKWLKSWGFVSIPDEIIINKL
ncbi:MAG: ABC transporter ATP-binding protein [Bacteroidetes bacterium]|nr:ABC transporter ATP-binding protein [Bacteroidota bacterium]